MWRGSSKKLRDIFSRLPVVGYICTVFLDNCKYQEHTAVTRRHRYWLLPLAVEWLPFTVEIVNPIWVETKS